MANVLSFFGDSDEVGDFMQKGSHKTRAYFINANGLPGFVVPYCITEYLKRAQEKN